MGQSPINILVWYEGRHSEDVYPLRIHGTLAGTLREQPDMQVWIAELDNWEQGITEATLAAMDVLVWWGHKRHAEVSDETVQRITERVREGMGFLPIHSSHYSRPFGALMGTECGVGDWREEGEPEHLTTLLPEHPIAQGLPAEWDIPETEMYAEPFAVPEPEEVVFHSRWDRGEEFRSGCTWTRGEGRIFYWRPGHESYRIFDQPHFQRVLVNGVRWCARRT